MKAPVRLTRHLHEYDKTPGHHNRRVRLKYATVREHYEQAMKTRRARGNADVPCPICEFYEAHLDDDVIKVEKMLLAHKEWGPTVCCDTILNTTRYNNAKTHPHGETIAQAVQHDAALALRDYHTWERIRGPLENLLRNRHLVFVSPEAQSICIDLIVKHHPNPRRFLEQPAVRDKVPESIDISKLPAPDFAHLYSD